MPEELQHEELNEFELSPEEQAELDKLDELNGDSDELQNVPVDENNAAPGTPDEEVDIDVDDEFLNELTANKDPLAPADEEENEDNNNGQEGNQGNNDNPDIDNPGDDDPIDDEQLPEPPDYTEQLNAVGERIFEAQGNIDDTIKQLEELSTKFDDGEIGQGQYDLDRLKLTRQLNKHERTLVQIEAEQQELQSEANEKLAEYQAAGQTKWQAAVNAFITDPANALIANNRHIAEQFDQILGGMNQAGLLDGLTQQQVLSAVRSQLALRVPQLNDTPYTPSKDAAKQQQQKPAKPSQQTATKVPPSLSQMQAIDTPQDDPFAYIRKLTGVDYEVAISKLSPEQQETFLFG